MTRLVSVEKKELRFRNRLLMKFGIFVTDNGMCCSFRIPREASIPFPKKR
jgi:hypothetical protein